MTTNNKVALIGATGKAGKYILQQLLTSGYPVKALIRKPELFTISHTQLEVVRGDVIDEAAVDLLIKNCTVVISALGQRAGEPLCSEIAARHIISAMHKQGCKRFIFLAGLNLDVPGDQKSSANQAKSAWMKQNYPDAVADKQTAFELLAASDIDYTMIRLPMIEQTDEHRKLVVDLHDSPGEVISTADLAEFIVRQLDDVKFVRKAPFVASL